MVRSYRRPDTEYVDEGGIVDALVESGVGVCYSRLEPRANFDEAFGDRRVFSRDPIFDP